MSNVPRYELQTHTTTIPTADVLARYVDRAQFEQRCRECPNYGKIWTCPPLAFDPEFVWTEYDNLEVVCDQIILRDEDIAYSRPGAVRYPDEVIDGLKTALYCEAKRQLEERLMRKEEVTKHTRALFPGTCNRCGRCQRVSNKPCIAPDTIRYSIETLGGDIPAMISELFDLEFVWAKKGEVPAHYILVGGILS